MTVADTPRSTLERLRGHAMPDVFGGVDAGTFIGFLCMIGGMFMAILDIQIVSSSLAEIQAGLSASSEEIAWVQSSYLIAEVIMIPFSGFLSRLLSTRIVFVASALSFTAASFLCATATSLPEMIVYRALQGFLGGAMIPTVFAASFQIFGRERNAAIGVLWGLIATLAPTIGPTLGGYLTQLMSWHWLFLINVPFGLIIAFAVWTLIDIDEPDWSLANDFDWTGLFSMAVFLGALHYVLEEGPKKDWFDDGLIRQLSVLTLAAGALFFWKTLRSRNPIVELHAFQDRNFALGTSLGFFFGVCLYGVVYLIPVYLARVQGLNSLQIGEIMFVTGLFQFMSAPLGGVLARQSDPRLVLMLGLGILGLSNYLFTPITSEWNFWDMFWPQALRGVGLMWSMIPINMIAMGTMETRYLKSAAGLFNLLRNLGGAFGLGLLNTQLTERVDLHTLRIYERLSPADPQVRAFLDGFAARFQSMAEGDPDIAAMKVMDYFARQQAMTIAFADVFLLIAAGCVLMLVALPLLSKPSTPAGVIPEPEP